MPWYLWILVALGYAVAFVAGRSWKHTKLEAAVHAADDAFFELRQLHAPVRNRNGILWCHTCSLIAPCASWKIVDQPKAAIGEAFDD